MGLASALACRLLDHAFGLLADNIAGLTLDEALFVPAGGCRSLLGTIKHTAAWSHVYRAFAFDPQPTGWADLDWPRNLRDQIETSDDYLADVIAWLALSHSRWMDALRDVSDDHLAALRPLHWGQTAPLSEIVIMVANHHVYHAGEINQLLALRRGEAWEEGEEVEENYVATTGHRVKPTWQ
jgi:hypothetical protein